MGVHVAHLPRGHGPDKMASSRRGDLLVLGVAHGGCYPEIVFGKGTQLGPRWWRPGGLPGSAPRASHRLAVD